jgi:hypothetical protein
MIVRAAAMGVAVAPSVPPVGSAPAYAGLISVSAPIPAGAPPAVLVPAILPAVLDELSLLERQELTGQGHKSAPRYPSLGRAGERQCGAQRNRKAKSKFSRHGPDSPLPPYGGRRPGCRDCLASRPQWGRNDDRFSPLPTMVRDYAVVRDLNRRQKLDVV